MKTQHPHTLCGETLAAPVHVCAFFDSRSQQYDVTIPYMLEGLYRNEKVINILESAHHQEHSKRLSDAGISIEKHEKDLNILASEDTYLKGGSFGAEKMLQFLEDALIEAENEGYESVRACGEMVWALKDVEGTDELIEYEARLNLLVPKHSCSLVCMYDVSRFSGRVLTDVLATHSHVIMNGRIFKNPYYIDPLEFLPILHRRSKRSLVP